ncbi:MULTISPECIES: CDP-glycerol glycerophosphotransferase family protein [Listeria]|uniref:CDP-glycerol glycerophosphotransferase family protein n=1 Tax=Listeria TaxID=1637 RepID=UPI0013566620|nr:MULTISPECIES: CDP-glycerol glycerophosphotransferase family protein [Listeria]
MKRILASVYMCFVKVIAFLCRMFKRQNKVVMLITFSDSPEQISKKMVELKVTPETIVFYDPRLDTTKIAQNFMRMIPMKTKTLVSRIYHMSTAKVVLVDNYFPELAVMKWAEGTICVQIWHASGALKKFAWEDKSVAGRTAAEQTRFKRVYAAFTHVVVGSDVMADIFKRSFLLDDSKLLKIGVPSTDYFFQKEEVMRVHKRYRAKYHKKTILYAPTYRDNELGAAKLLIDVEMMREKLASEYVLLLKLHPAIASQLDVPEDDFVRIVPKAESMKEVLAGSDILVTDYSSTPVDFALLGRPVYFYTPDLETYDSERGLVTGYLDLIPGTPYQTTEALSDAILAEAAHAEQIEAFKKSWNKYSTGNASEKLVSFIKKNL